MIGLLIFHGDCGTGDGPSIVPDQHREYDDENGDPAGANVPADFAIGHPQSEEHPGDQQYRRNAIFKGTGHQQHGDDHEQPLLCKRCLWEMAQRQHRRPEHDEKQRLGHDRERVGIDPPTGRGRQRGQQRQAFVKPTADRKECQTVRREHQADHHRVHRTDATAELHDAKQQQRREGSHIAVHLSE